MFIFNLKLNKKIIMRAFITISLLIIVSIILYSVYIIFFKKTSICDSYKNEILDLNETNYTNILKNANENVALFVGKKVRITGYVYRLIDFNANQFVAARDMRFNNNSQSLIVGFLCESNQAHKFSDGTWVEIIGKIKKGKLNDEIAVLDVISIKETTKPDIVFVNPPDAKGDGSFLQKLQKGTVLFCNFFSF